MENATQYINIRGGLMSLSRPLVMGIVNVTDDSFYSGSRTFSQEEIAGRVRRLVAEGADILDVGGYSSRAGAPEVSPEEEYRRLALGLETIAREAPETPVSIDTFRADVAARCAADFRVDMINDISGGDLDPEMWPTVARLKIPYIVMHTRGNPETMQSLTDYDDVTAEVLTDLSRKVRELHLMGVNDVIIDPGFGFAKTLDQNYQLLAEMSSLRSIGVPILVGISRKSMIYKELGITPEESLNGTTAVNTLALAAGADILRVHDVRQAVEAVRIYMAMRRNTPRPC